MEKRRGVESLVAELPMMERSGESVVRPTEVMMMCGTPWVLCRAEMAVAMDDGLEIVTPERSLIELGSSASGQICEGYDKDGAEEGRCAWA